MKIQILQTKVASAVFLLLLKVKELSLKHISGSHTDTWQEKDNT